MRIGFLGFGEAARAFHDTLAAHDPGLDFCAWDRLLPEPGADMRSAMEERGVIAVDGPELLSGAEWVISAVTADQSRLALEALLPHLRSGQVVVDVNSVSPGRKRDCAALVEEAGGRYLDMAVMAPVHPRGHRTPVLVAAPEGERLADALSRLDFDFRVVGEAPGAATAIKMVRSLFVKGLEAITVETLLAAEASGCFDEILSSVSQSYPGLGWPDFAGYQVERTTRHGARRAAEMRESGATLDALGLRGALAAEVAEVQERLGRAGPDGADPVELRTRVQAVLRDRRESKPGETG